VVTVSADDTPLLFDEDDVRARLAGAIRLWTENPDRCDMEGREDEVAEDLLAVFRFLVADAKAQAHRELRVQARGLRLTLAAQVRQLGVLETVRQSTDRLVEELRRQVAAAVPCRDGQIPEVVADRLRAAAHAGFVASEKDDGLGRHDMIATVGNLHLIADALTRWPGSPTARAIAAALSGEAETDAR
jgi:hypothetical protein